MKSGIFFIFFTIITSVCFSQIANEFIVGGNLDLIKSDNDGYFEKAQTGFELNYFFSPHITGTAGLEVWTREGASAVIGTRWYPAANAYIRLRGLIGDNDLSIGGGWAKPMTENLRFETMTDFYFKGNFTIRAGIAYLFRKK